MGRFKKTNQIFAHLNITLLNSNVLRFRDRTFPIKKNAIALSTIYLQFKVRII
jgi:hypothetical protein